MCVVSMIGDHYNDKWRQPVYEDIFGNLNKVSRQEFEALRKEVLEMKELLKKAVEYDKKNNEPHCEKPEKIELLKKIAKLFDIDLDGILIEEEKQTEKPKQARKKKKS